MSENPGENKNPDLETPEQIAAREAEVKSQADIQKTRDVVEKVVLSRLPAAGPDGYFGKELRADTREAGNERFKEAATKILEELVVHGFMGKDKQGNPELKNVSDLDGNTAIKLFQLAGAGKIIKYVNQGEEIKGGVMVDTGDKYGLVSEEGLYFDHHGKEAKNDTCATKIVYDALVRLELIDPQKYTNEATRKNYLEEAVNFVNQVDNEAFPLDEQKFRNLDRSIYGLERWLKPEALIEFFKNGGDPEKLLSQQDIENLDKEKKPEEISLIKRSNLVKKNIATSLKLLETKKENGMIVDGIIVDIGGEIPALGFKLARAFGFKGYLNYSPDKGSGSFFLSTVGELKPEFSQGVDMRGRHMWTKPLHNPKPLEVTLEEILSKLTDGKFQPEGELKKYLEEESKKTTVPPVPVPERGPTITGAWGVVGEGGKNSEAKESRPENSVPGFIPEGVWRSTAPRTEAERKSALRVETVKTFDSVVEDLGHGAGTLYGKEKTDINYRKVNALFKEATNGRNLNQEAKEAAKKESESEGRAVMKKSEWNNKENVDRFTRSVEKRNYGVAVRSGWDALSDPERQKYHGNIKEYIGNLKTSFRDINANVAKLNKDVYFDLIKQGYKPESFKVIESFWNRPIWQGLFGNRKAKGVEMVGPDGKPVKKTIEELTALEATLATQKTKQAKEAMDKMYGVAVANWQKRKVKAAGQIIVKTFGVGALAENLYQDGLSRKAVLNMTRAEAARNVWAPKILSIEGEISAAEADAARRNSAADAVVKEIGKAYKLKTEDVNVISEYVKTGKGSLPKVPGAVSRLVALLVSKRGQIGQWLTGKLDSLNKEIAQVHDQQEEYFLRRINRATQ